MEQDNLQPNRKKVGLALGGGFIRATAQIGVIEVLEKNNIPIDMVAGCSSGCAMASTYVVGTIDQLKKRLSEGTPKDFKDIIFEFAFPSQGFLKGEKNQKFFEEFLGEKKFEDLDRPLFLAATDLHKMEGHIMQTGKLSKAVRACTAVPGVINPVKHEGRTLIDGANYNLIPSQVLYENGADYVIAVSVSQKPNPFTRFLSNYKRLLERHKLKCQQKSHEKTLHLAQIIRRAVTLSALEIENFYHHSYPYNILIRPDVEHIKRTEYDKVDYCVEQGRKAAEKMLPLIKKDLGIE